MKSTRPTAPRRRCTTRLDAFFTEHQRYGELEAGVEGPVVWIACECGTTIAGLADEGDALDVNG
jgi:hypothetical protein